MQEPSKFCPRCNTQNYERAMFCYSCTFKFSAAEAPPPRRNSVSTFLLGFVVVFLGGVTLLSIIAAIRDDKPAPAKTAALQPTPAPTPVLSPAEHMAEAKKLLAQPYSRDGYNQATLHLSAIPEEAKEYKEAARMIPKVAERWQREEYANDPKNQLVVVKSTWEKGGFGAIAMWYVTLRNNSDRPIGDIQYRTVYYSETGNQVDKGGVDSALGNKLVQKVIPPKSTRRIEINDGFTHSEAHRASFELVEWRFVADSR